MRIIPHLYRATFTKMNHTQLEYRSLYKRSMVGAVDPKFGNQGAWYQWVEYLKPNMYHASGSLVGTHSTIDASQR